MGSASGCGGFDRSESFKPPIIHDIKPERGKSGEMGDEILPTPLVVWAFKEAVAVVDNVIVCEFLAGSECLSC